ncbi:transcriptional regulator [Cupriavidus metallidurans]|uniref:transcriptional regulator n=1 Tax=Cupriavidus metallidurans TaxID=119219 RepID=UPI000CE061B5|nr:transcriptional regulator [Cupriavidus metallidurans]AVA33376.1 transcriptional regulator [Cupriavidus metallidurans]
MKTLRNYVAPSTDDLAALKMQLAMTGDQMAELAAVAGSNQWRKYTGGREPRSVGPHMLFWIAARLQLSEEELAAVLAKMRELGASFDFDETQS